MILHTFKLVVAIWLTLQFQGAVAAQLVDGLGDPLPQRAVARFGSSRFRHGGGVDRVLFSPEGTKLVSWGGVHRVSEGIIIWEAATGKEVRRVAQPGARLEAWAWAADGRLIGVLKSPDGKHAVFDWSAANVEGQALPERDDGDDSRFAVSPSGKLLAVSSHGREGRGYTVEFRELSPDRTPRDARVLRVVQADLDYATVLRFTPDGQKLIVFTPPNRPQRTQWTAVVWDVETARELGRIILTARAFGPGETVDASNERIAAIFPIGTARLYDLRTGKEERLAEANEPADRDDARTVGGAVTVRFSADGSTLVMAGPAEEIRFWNVRDRKKTRAIASGGYGIQQMVLSRDGKVLAVGGRDGFIRLLDTATGALISPRSGNEQGVLSVAVSADSRIAATTGLDRTIRIWDLERAKELRVIKCDGYLRDSALTPDSKTVLAAVNPDLDPDHAVLHLWDVSNGKDVQAAGLTGTKAESVRFAPDARTLFTLSGETITLRSWPQAERLREIKFRPREPRGFTVLGTFLAISPDGELLLTMVRHVNLFNGMAIDSVGGSLDLWETKSGKHVQQLAGSDGFTERAAFTRLGELIITSDARLWGADENPPARSGGVVHVLDSGTRRVKRTFRVPGLVTALAVSPDGRMAFFGGPDGTIHACDVATGGIRYRLAGHHDRVTSLATTADGRRLVSTSHDASALLWDLQSDLNVSLDSSVLEVVLKDLLTEPNSVFEGQGGRNPTIFFMTERPRMAVSAEQLLDPTRSEKEWKKLSPAQLELAREAAKNVVQRQDDRDDLARYRPIDKRIVVWDAQRAETKQRRRDVFGPQIFTAHTPGFSTDKQIAMVRVDFPWSIHSGYSTYVLTRKDGEWVVLVRLSFFFS